MTRLIDKSGAYLKLLADFGFQRESVIFPMMFLKEFEEKRGRGLVEMLFVVKYFLLQFLQFTYFFIYFLSSSSIFLSTEKIF